MEDHRLVGTQEVTTGDTEDEAVADLTGGSGDGNSNWTGAHRRLLRELGPAVRGYREWLSPKWRDRWLRSGETPRRTE